LEVAESAAVRRWVVWEEARHEPESPWAASVAGDSVAVHRWAVVHRWPAGPAAVPLWAVGLVPAADFAAAASAAVACEAAAVACEAAAVADVDALAARGPDQSHPWNHQFK
jgi:hypothetical protein